MGKGAHRFTATALAAIALTACTSAQGAGGGATVAAPTITAAPTLSSLQRGPNGEVPVSASSIKFTADELARIKAGNFTVGLIWADPNDGVTARKALKELGIGIAAEVDTNFDLQKEHDAVQVMLAKKPNVVLALIVDSAASAKNFQPLVDAKIPLIFEENIPAGFKYGQQYAGSVAQDYAAAATYAADIIAQSMGSAGQLGFLYYNANFYIVNAWDKVFKDTITKKYPNIVMVEAGFADPAKAQEVAAGLITRNPNLKGLYASWQEPLDSALAALRAAGKTNIPATCVGLGQSTALAIARRKQVPGVGGVGFYQEGALEADLVAYLVLGKTTPSLVISPAFPVTRANLAASWTQYYNTALPADVAAALAQP